MQLKNIRRATATALLAGATSAAQAHGGHGPHELWDMLTHAVGLEQGLILLALVVGVLAVRRWRARRNQTKAL
ncbi:MAG: hypothetical protein U1D25_06245 [Hydrogenophaga sp.]|uniref:hypothetical protein n=1 Tax=Hydrogenophaga sp. TaxID=1904254 RepID=UPI002756895A|nr:hypothetical protein [Hydrogenophaga sp.]MDP2416058.1 hypothetical protein [Hydrogenophaga sp.]MDZ4187693.1 hypothetical protein [Hydrogenophaga sp.]